MDKLRGKKCETKGCKRMLYLYSKEVFCDECLYNRYYPYFHKDMSQLEGLTIVTE